MRITDTSFMQMKKNNSPFSLSNSLEAIGEEVEESLKNYSSFWFLIAFSGIEPETEEWNSGTMTIMPIMMKFCCNDKG